MTPTDVNGSGLQAKPSPVLLVSLSAGPRTLAEIEDAFRGYGRRLPGDLRPYFGGRRSGRKLSTALADALVAAVGAGWVVSDGGRFALTDAGRVEAEKALHEARSRRDRIHRLLQPSKAAGATMAAQVAVTAVKVPAALISGSLAQLNDAIEELLDVIGTGVVYLGVRLGRERLANIVVVALMVATGGFAATLALRRLFVPFTPTVSWYPLTVAAVSVPFYVVRSTYERAAGTRGGNVALITQSVDSRNHAVVALGVVAGLLGVVFQLRIVDTLIGIGVALVILKSAVAVSNDQIRALRAGTEPELSRYSLWIAERLKGHVHAQTETWLLYLIGHEHVTRREEVIRRAEFAIGSANNPLLREFGMEIDAPNSAEPVLAALVNRGWLTGTEQLALTDSGRRHLRRTLRRRY